MKLYTAHKLVPYEINIIQQGPRIEVGDGGVVGLWTLKMVYLVPTQYFMIQLQLINHFF